jgi:hypothetical protein
VSVYIGRLMLGACVIPSEVRDIGLPKRISSGTKRSYAGRAA